MSQDQNDLLIIKNAIESGVNNVSIHKQELNELNVFPIPDGDTGYNLNATLLSGWDAIKNSNYKSRKIMLNDFSEGLLFGARGNSGVVFTQIIRGLVKHIIKIPVKDKIKFTDFYSALLKCKKFAYKSINKPVEGTLLTIISDLVSKLPKKMKGVKNYIEGIKIIVDIADKSVKNTPNLLPVLKEAGVVDSGAKGLYYFLEGILLSNEGNPVQLGKRRDAVVVDTEYNKNNELDYKLTMLGYCTEFIIQLKPKMKINNVQKLITKELEKSNYNSFVILNEKKHIKVHVHTFKPSKVLQLAHKYGEFIKVKVDNMTLQNQHVQEFKNIHMGKLDINKTYVISFVTGNGWGYILKKTGISKVVIYNGSSIPSVKKIVELIKRALTKNIIILSNNSNLNMAINEAIKICSNYNIYLTSSSNNGEIYAALNYYNLDLSFKDQKQVFEESIKNSLVVNISQASKKYKNNSVEIIENDYISIINSEIKYADKNFNRLIKKCFSKINLNKYDLITLFYGTKISKDKAQKLSEFLENKYNLDIKVIKGDNKIYLYTIIFE